MPEIVVRQPLHPDEYTTGTVILVPVINVRGEPAPTAQVEVADAEVRSRRESQGLLQRRKEAGVRCKVVEDTRHRMIYRLTFASLLMKPYQLGPLW